MQDGKMVQEFVVRDIRDTHCSLTENMWRGKPTSPHINYLTEYVLSELNAKSPRWIPALVNIDDYSLTF